MNSGARFPLLAKMLVWLLVHLVILGGGFFLFAAWQLRLGLDSLLSGAAGDHLKSFGGEIAAELRETDENDWPRVLREHGQSRGLKVSLRGLTLPEPIGDVIPIPENIDRRLEEIRRNGPPGARLRPPPRRDAGPPPRGEDDPLRPEDRPGGPGGRGPQGDDEFPWEDGPPEDRRPEGRRDHILDNLPEEYREEARPPRGARQGRGGEEDRPPRSAEGPGVQPFFLMRGDHSDGYWAAMDIAVFQPQLTTPRHLMLLVRSDTASAGGLFFDFTPWLQGGAAVFVLSLVLWAPFFLGITRYLSRLSKATEAIAAGKFDVQVSGKRSDELGLLGQSIETMASRLDRLVTGQKRFLADVAHELCSPLARIRTGFGVLENSVDLTHRDRIESIDEDVEELSRLVSEVLAFTKASTAPGAVRLEAVELLPLIERALSRECPGQPADLKIPDGLAIKADRALLDRAIANIFRNARRHAGDESCLTVSAAPSHGLIQLSIADNGPGVAAADLPRLFEPFYRPDAARTRESGGSGLGLAIVRSAIEACGGSVRAEPAHPQGLSIVILLPVE